MTSAKQPQTYLRLSKISVKRDNSGDHRDAGVIIAPKNRGAGDFVFIALFKKPRQDLPNYEQKPQMRPTTPGERAFSPSQFVAKH